MVTAHSEKRDNGLDRGTLGLTDGRGIGAWGDKHRGYENWNRSEVEIPHSRAGIILSGHLDIRTVWKATSTLRGGLSMAFSKTLRLRLGSLADLLQKIVLRRRYWSFVQKAQGMGALQT